MAGRFLSAGLLGLLATQSEAGGVNVTYVELRPVEPEYHTLIIEKQDQLKYRDDIATLIENVQERNFNEYVNVLSGESTSSEQFTRVSTSITNAQGIRLALSYVQGLMTSFGFPCELDDYRSDYAPNLVCTQRGSTNPDELVVLGAHIDDIPANGRAPGANDDGSGSAAVLAIAKAIADSGARFERSIAFEWYTGEEQGLRGSAALARTRAQRGDRVIGQIQQDMTAVHLPQDPRGLSFVLSSTATDTVLSDYLFELAKLYADEDLQVYRNVLSGSNCCSDHQSYKANGFPSVGLIEPRGYTGDPQYHRIGDVVARAEYDPTQATYAARVALAGAADLAGLL